MVDWCHFLECASFLWFRNLHGHISCRVSSPFEVEYCGKVGGPNWLVEDSRGFCLSRKIWQMRWIAFGTLSKYVNSRFDFYRWSSHCWWFRNPAPGREKQYTTSWNRPGHLSTDWFRISSINHFNAKEADSMRAWAKMLLDLTADNSWLNISPLEIRPYWGLISLAIGFP